MLTYIILDGGLFENNFPKETTHTVIYHVRRWLKNSNDRMTGGRINRMKKPENSVSHESL